jgi:hypothetical protein
MTAIAAEAPPLQPQYNYSCRNVAKIALAVVTFLAVRLLANLEAGRQRFHLTHETCHEIYGCQKLPPEGYDKVETVYLQVETVSALAITALTAVQCYWCAGTGATGEEKSS